MKSLWYQPLTLIPILYFVHATAVPTLDISHSSILRRDAPDGPDLNGVYFGDPDSKCTAEEIKTMKRTLHNIRDFANQAADADERDPMFLKFFGDGWNGTPQRQIRYDWIRANLRRAGDFPADGIDGENRHKKENRLIMRCDDKANLCKGKALGGYASDGRTYNSAGSYINLCPRFFDRYSHIDDRAKQTKTPYLVTLATREHILLHEILHADIINTPEHIEDVETALGLRTVIVYGPANCEALAKKKAPSVLASRNADSYAWFATAVYFRARWPKIELTASNPHDELRDQRRVDIYGDDEQVVHYDTIPDVPGDEPAAPPPASPPKPALNCVKDCCSYVPDQQWCNANCGGRTC